jgi:glycosyltransferase involved in cell wall biosynthesis
MPEGVDVAKYNTTTYSGRWWPDQGRVYLYHGDWQERKGIRFLIEAWRSARPFMPGAKLKLIAKKGMSTSMDAAQALVRELDVFCGDDGPHKKLDIEVIHGTLPESVLCSMYRSAYCGVFPTRGEAWNLAPCQMAACGTPVIVTAWGGHLEYLSPLSAFLIPVEAFRWISADGNCGVESYCQQQFAVPDVRELIRLLKWTYGHPAAVRARGARAMKVVTSQFTWDAAAGKIAARMERILSHGYEYRHVSLFERLRRI